MRERMRTWFLNVMLVLGLCLVAAPTAMRLYGRWAERHATAAILDTAAPIPQEAPAPGAAVADGPVRLARVPRHGRAPERVTNVRKPNAPRATVRKAAAGMAADLPKSLPRRRWEPSVLEIPRIGVRAAVQRGVGNWWKIPGPAYEVWSAGPGGSGNPVIAAHRNMWDETFMDLPRVRPGDALTIRTRTHRYDYVVDTSRRVSTKDVSLLSDTKDARITLYTCVLPFNANRRWIVQGHLASAAPRRLSAHR